MNRQKFLLRSAAMILAGPTILRAAVSEHTYTVRKGDTLSQIAQKQGMTVKQLKSYNGLTKDLIVVGQKLKIPSGHQFLEGVRAQTTKLQLNRPKWKYIIAHHSATPYGNASSYDKVDRTHGMENGLAYHFVIGSGKDSGDGEIEIGSRWTKQLHGGHVSKQSYNDHGIGICLVGNFEKTKPTSRQMVAFTELVDYLGNDLLNGNYKFMVHREVNATLCPGRNFPTTAMHKRFN
ncbi:MAG: N-acetylmuramoyl-L-alanine amidase [Verrucomicrobia bacterium]|nr:N-acetylmuramoyl-L-alanine amidase [Verrucomicrobiota bacterium]MDA1066024.1 N-acetylmuramoyl-L-alanine amidase [Verrucomicrobiota bacterium]